jgi:DnaJ family protein B protein 4
MSVNSDDLYERLGINKNASDDEIKKAYKKSALKWHPDRNGHQKDLATENFKKISEAYEILSDPSKKNIYDQCGMKGFEEGGGMSSGMHNYGEMPNFGGMNSGHFRQFNFPPGFPFVNKNTNFSSNRQHFNFTDPNEIFGMFFNNNTDMFGEEDMGFFRRNPSRGNRGNRGNRENFFAKTRKNNMGQNARDMRDMRENDEEQIITHNAKIDLEILYNGGTKKFKISNNGKEKIFDIDIKPGWKAGTKVTFEDENIGTVIFVIEEKDNLIFRRVDNDLIHRRKINPSENILTIETFSKKKINIDLKNKNRGEKITIPNEGMPIRKNGVHNGYGDLIIELV